MKATHSTLDAADPRVVQYIFFDDIQDDKNGLVDSAPTSTTAGENQHSCGAYIRATSAEGSQDDDSWCIKQGKRSRLWSSPVGKLEDQGGRLESGGMFPSDDEDDDDGDDIDDDPDSFQETMKVSVHEALSDDFGLFTWPSAVVLAWTIWKRRRDFRGARVVEIGAGTALPGLLAAKLGASVTFTDRDGAPWVLENIRAAARSNGLPLIGAHVGGGETSQGEEVLVPPLASRDSVPEGTDLGLSFVQRTRTTHRRNCEAPAGEVEATRGNGQSRSGDLGVVAVGAWGQDSTGEHLLEHSGNDPECLDVIGDREKSGERTSAGGGQDVTRRTGECSVQPLSWGRITRDAIELASRRRPQGALFSSLPECHDAFPSCTSDLAFILGADVFYDSADFNAVLATVHLLLAGSVTSCHGSTPGKSRSTAPASSGITSRTHPLSAAQRGGTPVKVDHERKTHHESTGFCPDIGVCTARKPTFLTAYQERSARRTIRPLLRKWGLSGRLLDDGPEEVLPRELWESGRYDSVALVEISLSEAQR